MKRFTCILIALLLSLNFSFADTAKQKRILINIPSDTLSLYNGETLVKTYPVCTGRPAKPSPLGKFHVIYKVVNPYWYKDGKVTPPGKANPLGIRWIGFMRDTGIHGNNNPKSIGTYASSGCIRMYNRDVAELYNQVPVNTPVELTYERLQIVQDKYADRQVAIIYPDVYRLNNLDPNQPDIPDGLKSLVAKAAHRASKQPFAVSDEGAGMFLNRSFVTSDAFYIDKEVYMNCQAAEEALGITTQVAEKFGLQTVERNNKVYLRIDNIITALGGKITKDTTSGNSYIKMDVVKVNGIFLTNACGNFDSAFKITVGDFNKLGLEKEAAVTAMKLTSKTKTVDIGALIKAFKGKARADSIARTLEIRIPCIVKAGDKEYETQEIEGQPFISEAAAMEIDTLLGISRVFPVQTYKGGSYVRMEDFLTGCIYASNEFLTVIQIGVQENQ